MTQEIIVSPESSSPDFIPVPRRDSRHDGWTVARQRAFVAALGESGSVRLSLLSVGMAAASAYRLRNAKGAESFAAAWDAALDRGSSLVRDVLLDQAINGIPEPIVYGGAIVGERRRFNHRTMMWVMQHHRPDKYGGGSTTHRRGWGGKRGPEGKPWPEGMSWREAGVAESRLSPGGPEMLGEDLREKLEAKLAEIHNRMLADDIAPDPAKRAAWELLNGPVDWEGV